MYAERYSLPVFCTETAGNGPPWKRCRWIAETLAQVQSLRAEGVPLVGYTYWPLYSLVAWPYQRGQLPLSRYVLHLGLWDLKPDLQQPGVLRREPTLAVDCYREAV